MGFAPTWLRQVSPPASQNHFNHCQSSWRREGFFAAWDKRPWCRPSNRQHPSSVHWI